MKEKFNNVKKIITRKQTENEIIEKQIEDNKNKITEITEDLQLGQEALQFVEDVANSRRSVMKDQIEEIITEALHSIYGPDYGIELVYNVKNNRSNLDILLVRNTDCGEIKRNMDGFGGGVADTISMPLRLLVLLASKQTDTIGLLDECFKHVDTERVELVGLFLKTICDRLGVQLVMCSHHELLKDNATSTYQIKDINGKSVVTKL